jgi:hypothetical protein
VYDADFRGRKDGAKGQSMTSVGEVTAEEGRGRKCFSAPSREWNRQSLAYETSMVPQDHCQRTFRTKVLTVAIGVGQIIG